MSTPPPGLWAEQKDVTGDEGARAGRWMFLNAGAARAGSPWGKQLGGQAGKGLQDSGGSPHQPSSPLLPRAWVTCVCCRRGHENQAPRSDSLTILMDSMLDHANLACFSQAGWGCISVWCSIGPNS